MVGEGGVSSGALTRYLSTKGEQGHVLYHQFELYARISIIKRLRRVLWHLATGQVCEDSYLQ